MSSTNPIQAVLSPQAIAVCRRLHEYQFQAYIVGGAVRDALLQRPLGDIDIATNATPAEVETIFEQVIPTGKAFGTMTVVVKAGDQSQQYQVTTFRTEQGYSDGRHPDQVMFSQSIHDDLVRRDFTINALAWDPINKTLIDDVNGRYDLQHKQLRTVGDPSLRFQEDTLRLFRLCRFQAQLGFEIESKTGTAGQQLSPTVTLPSAERIYEELWKGLDAPYSWAGLETARSFGLLQRVFPAIKVSPYPAEWPDWIVEQRLAYLLQSSDDYQAQLKAARFPNAVISMVKSLIENQLNLEHAQFKVADLDISGDDLSAYGLEGRLIRTTLEEIRELVLSKALENTKAVIIDWLDRRGKIGN